MGDASARRAHGNPLSHHLVVVPVRTASLSWYIFCLFTLVTFLFLVWPGFCATLVLLFWYKLVFGLWSTDCKLWFRFLIPNGWRYCSFAFPVDFASCCCLIGCFLTPGIGWEHHEPLNLPTVWQFPLLRVADALHGCSAAHATSCLPFPATRLVACCSLLWTVSTLLVAKSDLLSVHCYVASYKEWSVLRVDSLSLSLCLSLSVSLSVSPHRAAEAKRKRFTFELASNLRQSGEKLTWSSWTRLAFNITEFFGKKLEISPNLKLMLSHVYQA